MAKIGLVTFSNSYDNYGQVMQALATQEYLKSRGHDVFLLRENFSCWEKCILHIKLIIKRLILLMIGYDRFKSLDNIRLKLTLQRVMEEADDKRHPRYMEEFRRHHFKISVYSEDIIKKLNISVLCTGSDQIWTLANPYFFLRYGSPNLKRISIAPSTGNRNIPLKDNMKIAEWLPSYSFITTREESGVKMCKSLGYYNVCKVLDPTFLLSADDYLRFASSRKEVQPYLMLYLLNAQAPVEYGEIVAFAQSNGLEVKYVTGGRRYDNHKQIYATVQDWISLMYNAKYVITNSFHGMVFSIIFRKKFLVLPLSGSSKMTNERIYNVTSELGLEKRIYSGSLQEVFNTINYSIAEKRIKNNKIILDNLMIDNGL